MNKSVTSLRLLALGALLAAIPVGRLAAQDPIHWQPSIDSAAALAAQSNRLVLVHFWAPSCKPCLALEKDVFSQSQFGPTLEANYVPVKVNADVSPAYVKYYGIKTIPTDVLLTPNGQVLATLQSPADINNYVAQLDQVSNGYRQLLQSGYGQPPVQPVAATVGNSYVQQTAAATPQQGGPAQANYASNYQQPVAPPQGQPNAVAGANPAMNNSASSNPAFGAGGAGGTGAVDRQVAAAPGGSPAPRPLVQQSELPPGSPPLGLDGYCSVTLVERQAWEPGDKRWGAVHRGRTYLFKGPEEQKRFLADPDSFSPVLSGDDPVIAVDQHQSVPGSRAHGVFCHKRIYLFANEETQKQFAANIRRYTETIQQAAVPTTVR